MKQLDCIPKDCPIVLQCRTGLRSAIAASILQRAGIKEVVNLKGGFLAWKKKSFLIQLVISMCREIIFINLSDKENYGLHRSISINRRNR